jgi:hypothetical protein
MFRLIERFLRRASDALADRQVRAAAHCELQSLVGNFFSDIGVSHRAAAEWPQSHRRAGP